MAITLTNPNNRPVVTGESVSEGVSVAIDYTSYYERIATALETLATNSTAIKTAVETIATQQTTIAVKQTAMETYQKKLKELGEADGIHVVGPYEWLSMYSIYRLLVEQGTTDFASLKAQVDALPKNF